MGRHESPGEIALRDAAMSVGTWGARARRYINEDFGDGYAEKHPELVAAYVRASAMQYLADTMTRSITEAADRLADAWLEQPPDLPAVD